MQSENFNKLSSTNSNKLREDQKNDSAPSLVRQHSLNFNKSDPSFSLSKNSRGHTGHRSLTGTFNKRPKIGMAGAHTPLAGQRAINNISFNQSFAEVVEEEKHEEDEERKNLLRRQSRFKMLEDKNEFNKKSKRNRSTDFLREKDVKLATHQNNIGNVSEDDEEEISDSSLEKLADQNKNMKKSKTYQIAHLTKKIWSNKIYSDDFDVEKEII